MSKIGAVSLPRLLVLTLFRFLKPSSPQLLGGNAGQVRLDIENGSAVEHVDTANMQPRSLAPDQFHDRESDGIGPSRRTGGEDSVRTIVGGRGSQAIRSLRRDRRPRAQSGAKSLRCRSVRLRIEAECRVCPRLHVVPP